MKGRQSRYVTGGESFAEIARLPSGAVVRLCLNTGLEDALREASKSLKSAFTRSGRKCRLSAGTAQGPFTGRHCCKVSDEAAFCLIQRPYISKTLLTRRISPRGSP